MQGFIKNVVWFCLLAIPFIALYVASGWSFDLLSANKAGMYFPFISGKNLLFRLLVEVALAGWVFLLLKDSKYRINLKSPLTVAYSIFMAVILIADIFGVDTSKSILSNFERMEGFVGHIHFYAYFLIMLGMLHTVSDWKKVWKYFLASDVLVLIYGYCQLFGAKGYIFSNNFPKMAEWFSSKFPIHMSENRLDATIGNSAYFAIFCLMSAGIAAILWVQSQNPKKERFYPILIVLNLIGIFYSGTRGTMIGLIAGAIITFGIIAWHEKGKSRKIFAGILIAMIIAVSSIFVFKNSDFIKSSPTLARVASISFTDLTTMSRLSIWTISYEAWKERPILGYGQDNFSYIFARKFIPEKMWNLEPWYDRSHNVFFDWLIAGGILGLLSYLSLYFVALYLLWFKKNSVSVREKSIITGVIAGYFVHNVAVFDNLTSYIIFFALLAYIVVITGGDKVVSKGKSIDNDQINLLYAPLIVIVFVASVYYAFYKPLMVNRSLVKGMNINQLVQDMPFSQAVDKSNEYFKESIAYKTVGSEEAREQYLQMGVRLAQLKIPEGTPAEERNNALRSINKFASSVREDITNSFESHKTDIRMLSIYGMFYNGIGDGASGENILSLANKIAPNKQLISFDLAKSYLLQNKVDEAYALSMATYNLAPPYQDAQKWYLISAAYAKKFKEAREHIKQKNGQVPIDGDILNSLVNTGQTNLAIEMLNDVKKTNPEYAPQIDAYVKGLLAPKSTK